MRKPEATAGLNAMPHVEQETLADYVAGDLAGSAMRQVKRHLDVCDHCKVREAEFKEMLDLLSGRTVETTAGESLAASDYAACLEDGLTAATAVAPAWQQRIQDWGTHWKGKAAAAFVSVVTASERAVEVVSRPLEVLTVPFQPLPADIRTYGAIRIHGAVRTRGGPPAKPSGPPEPQIAPVTIKSEGGRLLVRIEQRPDSPLPLILLIPLKKPGLPLIHLATREPGGAACLFPVVPAGEYLVAVEPPAKP